MQDNTARDDERGGDFGGIHLVYSHGRRLDVEPETRSGGVPRRALVAAAVVALTGTLWWVGHAALLALRVR